MKQYLEVGKINNTHGVKGEMKLMLWCDDIDYLKQFDVLYLDNNGNKSVEIISVRPQKNNAIIKIEGINTIEQAEELKGSILYCDRDDAEIDEDANYIADLIGCYVVDIDTEEEYGKVVDVVNYGSCDIYDIESWGKHSLIPATPDIVKEINTEYKVIRIKAMKGLFDEN
ncbi:MAG: ribosome maturation factor RimM [Acetobacter sp.]|nr:ribosome maturation factor RimM [Bacteroides sp.]MCM1341598.1 ribosome maturation factor RimM [Acetobacter sp.]MCM1433675.1 ribosome maturation factor RimM [Clostridiales bacterium]